MYSMEIKDGNFTILTVLHFLDLTKAYDFVKNFNCLHWAWNSTWKHIYVYRITDECDNEHIVNESLQFVINREAFERLK